MLELEGVHAGYGRIDALRGVSLAVGQGELVCLIGANGAGKTSTLKTISGLLRARAGRIVFDGAELHRLSPSEILRRGIAHCPEGRRVFPLLTVEENLRMGAYVRRDATVATDLDAVMTHFPILRERRRQMAGTLSGGEQQMLAMGRALMSRPRLLLLDEPSLGIAPLLVRDIFKTIVEINRRGTTVLLVEQNAHMALGIAQRGYVLETGRVVLEDTAANLAANDEVRAAYLGG